MAWTHVLQTMYPCKINQGAEAREEMDQSWHERVQDPIRNCNPPWSFEAFPSGNFILVARIFSYYN